MSAEFPGESEPVFVQLLMGDAAGLAGNVGHINARRAAPMRNCGCHEALNTASENQDMLSNEVGAFNRVDRIPERIHESDY